MLRNQCHALALACLRIYIKRRSGHLSYVTDPYALREIVFEEERHDRDCGCRSNYGLAPWTSPPATNDTGNAAEFQTMHDV